MAYYYGAYIFLGVLAVLLLGYTTYRYTKNETVSSPITPLVLTGLFMALGTPTLLMAQNDKANANREANPSTVNYFHKRINLVSLNTPNPLYSTNKKSTPNTFVINGSQDILKSRVTGTYNAFQFVIYDKHHVQRIVEIDASYVKIINDAPAGHDYFISHSCKWKKPNADKSCGKSISELHLHSTADIISNQPLSKNIANTNDSTNDPQHIDQFADDTTPHPIDQL